MKKRILTIALAASSALAMTFALAACSGDGTQKYTGERQEFTEPMYAQSAPAWQAQELTDCGYTFTGEGVTLDGKLDEAAWQNVYPLTYSSIGVTVSVYVVFGEDGFYAGYDVQDDEGYFNSMRTNENNSSVEIYFSPVGTTELDGTVLQIRMEPNGGLSCYRALGSIEATLSYPWSASYLPVYGLTVAENGWTIDSEGGWTTDGGQQYEMFIAWEALSLQEAPEQFKLFPCYNYINSASKDAGRVSQVWPQGRYNEPMDYFRFDKEGYVNNDDRLAEEYGSVLMGDAGNGLAKSAGWDFSEYGQGIISTDDMARGSRYLFVKGADDEAFMFSAEVSFKDSVAGDGGPRMGLVIGRSNSDKQKLDMHTRIFEIGTTTDSTNGEWRYTVKEGDDEGGKAVGAWQSTGWSSFSDNDGSTSDTPAKLTVVKQGTTFFCFINDTYVGSQTDNDFAEGCAVGLYSLGAQTVYSDLSYTTDADEMLSYLEENDIRIVTVTSNAGGSFAGKVGTTDVNAVQNIAGFVGTADVSLTITSGMDMMRTYVIESVTVNGETATLTKGGVYTNSDCSESLDIVITFKTATSGVLITFTGADAEVTITQTAGGFNTYRLSVSDGLSVLLPDGTWEVNTGSETVTVTVANGEVTSDNAEIEVG